MPQGMVQHIHYTIHDVCSIPTDLAGCVHSAYSNYIKTAWQRYWADSECVEDVGGTSGWHSQIYDMGNHGKMSKMFSHFIVAFRSLLHVAQETCMT